MAKNKRGVNLPPQAGRPKRIHGSREHSVRLMVPDDVWLRFRQRALALDVSAGEYLGWLVQRVDLELQKRR